MLTPQHLLPIHNELVIDLFAGGGGASTGIEEAIGRPVDIAINHNIEAVAMHLANHPQTKHYVSDVFEVDPVEVVAGRPVGMLWASPDCKHFSKAKGGKPVSKKIRGLAWVVIKWAKLVRPRVIFLENVEEFQTWGPLDKDNMPCKERKGRTFQRWKKSLENLGYKVHYQEDRACDLGTPTIRKRLFLVARCDGLPIVVPEYTHAAPGSLLVKQRKAKPYRTAAECIQWDEPAPSIFTRSRELADATKRRIAKGIMRYVVDAEQPFIVPLTHQGGDRTESLAEPFKTITGANRGEKALIVPTLIPRYGERDGQEPRVRDVQQPMPTVVPTGNGAALVTAFLTEHANASTQRVMPANEPMRTVMGEVKGGHFSVVAASLVKNYTGVVGSDMQDPMGTVTSVDHHSLLTATMVGTGGPEYGGKPKPVDAPMGTQTGENHTAIATAHLVHMGHGEGKEGGKRFSHGIRDVQVPLNTIAASGMPAGVVTSNLIKLRGTSKEGQPVDAPLHTVSAGGMHHAEVRAFLIKYYGTDQDPRLTEPMHTIPTKDRFGLVMVKGQPYAIVDIGLRMLKPRELYRAQGFKDSYIIDWGIHPHTGQKIKLTSTASIRMCGNSVCPPMARAYVASNYSERQLERMVA
jgi:DNA (cytosine-5)-methyltransferase 1